MKKLILISSLLAATTLAANAATETHLFQQTTGWTDDWGQDSNRARFSRDTTNDTMTLTNCNWNQSFSYYDYSAPISLADTIVSFSFDVTVKDSVNNNVFAFAVVLDQGAAVVGHDYHTWTVKAGTTTNVSKKGYTFSQAKNKLQTVETTTTLLDISSNVAFTISGSIANNTVVFTLTNKEDPSKTATQTLDLTGTTLTGFSFTGDGNNTIENLSLSNFVVSTSAIPEPSMFGLLAGLGALALVGARRRRR